MAQRGLPGRVIGGFKYFGTRPDDPNDIVPHEHRRELRALQVFGAWTNLVDMKAGNTLDTVITENGRAHVRHYLQDVGFHVRHRLARPARIRRGPRARLPGRTDGQASGRRRASTSTVADSRLQRNDEIGRFTGDAFEPENLDPARAGRLRSCGYAPTTRSGRRCA